MQIRNAVWNDVQGIMEIYNEAILNSHAVWREQPVDHANRLAWWQERQQRQYPVLVSLNEAEQVTGYASFGDWHAFEGYRYTVEHSVYVHPAYQRQGIGHSLLAALIERARHLGKHVMIAAIEARNQPSIDLHRRFGFKQTGFLPQVGIKSGQWLDLVFMQLCLEAH